MKNSNFLSLSLTRQEKTYGSVWLAFEALLFARLLQLFNTLLPAPLPQSDINGLFFAVNFVVVVLLFRRYLLSQLRLVPDVIERILLTAIPGFVAYCLINMLMAQLLFALEPGYTSVNDVTIQALVQENFPLMLIGTVILVPITEECLFRGLLFRGLYDRSPALAWTVSVVLFSAVHLISYIGAYPAKIIFLCFLQYIPAGLCLAGVYRLSGSLLSPILIHALVNFVGMLALR